MGHAKNWAPSNVFHTLYKQIIYWQRCLKDCTDFEEVANIWREKLQQSNKTNTLF